MKIFYAAPDYALDRKTVVTSLWRANLYGSLRGMGHDLVEFEIDYQPFNYNLDETVPEQRAFIEQNRPRFSEELLRQVKKSHQQQPIDLFFSYFYSAYVEPDAIREIGRLGIPTVNWYCNGSYQFHLVEDIAPAYEFCLVPEKFRLDDYRRVGATPIYCQEAANPAVYRPHDVRQDYDVTFVGQRYGTRPHFIKRLRDAGLDSRVWGPNWQQTHSVSELARDKFKGFTRKLRGREHVGLVALPSGCCGPPLSDGELIEMYSRSRISLGFTAVAHLPKDGSPAIQQVRLRDFEATMSGAFYMVEAFDELAEFFEPEKEVVFFSDGNELVEKAKYYLKHTEQRECIRQAGLRRARGEHTWQKRFEMVFDQMGIPQRLRKAAG